MYRTLLVCSVRIPLSVTVLAGLCMGTGRCEPVQADDGWSDRAVAEWVLRLGGSVVAAGQPARLHDIADLPSGSLRLRAVDLVTVVIKPDEINRLTNLADLEELYLSGRTWHNQPITVAADNFKALQRLTKLKKLVLSLPVQTEIPLDDRALVRIAPLTNLTELRLAQTRVKGGALRPFKNLQFLVLDHTRFDDAGMLELAGMSNLSKLYARDTLVTDEGLASLKHLKNLTELDLYGAGSRMPVWSTLPDSPD